MTVPGARRGHTQGCSSERSGLAGCGREKEPLTGAGCQPLAWIAHVAPSVTLLRPQALSPALHLLGLLLSSPLWVTRRLQGFSLPEALVS